MPSIHSFRKEVLIKRIQQDEKTIRHLKADINTLQEIWESNIHKIIDKKTENKKLRANRKEVFDLAHTIALANIDDRLVDPINKIAKLSEALEGK